MDHSRNSLSLRAKQKLKKDMFISHMLTIIQGFGFFVSLANIYYTYFRVDVWDVRRVLGLFLFVGSYGLWFCARIQLGNAFAVAAIASQAVGLKRDGLYRYFSHPIYIFSLTALIGYILLIGQITYGCVLVAVVGVVQTWRIQREKEVLFATFGEEYRRHCKRVWV